MRRGLCAVVMVLGLLAGTATAQGISTSPRPQPRPDLALSAPAEMAPPALIRPRLRPPPPVLAPPIPAPEAAEVALAEPASLLRPPPRPLPMSQALPPQPALATSLPVNRPLRRPESWAQTLPEIQPAAAPQAAPERRGGLLGGLFGRRERESKPAPADGFVCGDRSIRGEELAPISSSVRGCGIEEPVRVTSVDGIRLTTPATIDCATARALRTWVDEGLRPAFGRQDVVELRVAASYICRPRNNVRGAKVSEHGRGKAIDISGFILSDGRALSIAQDYNRTIRRAHRAACGIFGTTLGPGSDGYHEDHLHFDTANLDRPYCR